MSRRLVVCCDGTWSRPDQLRGGSTSPTNVWKLAFGVSAHDRDGGPQILFYQRGVGTRRFERYRGLLFGFGLSRNVREVYRFIVENYEPGAELYFFGFSRGAYTARSTVGLVRNVGILRPEHVDRIKDAYRLYRARQDDKKPNGVQARSFRRRYSHEEEIEIRFVGVWDTVGSLGIPLDVRVPFASKLWGFHDTALSSRVRFAYQALAIDEQRGTFKPTLWKQQEHTRGQVLEQVWFSGVHSDVGGGYPEAELAEIALLWMVDRARSRDLAFKPDHFTTPTRVDTERRQQGQHTSPDALGAIHESDKGIYRWLPRHRRTLDRREGSNESVASSAVRRLREKRGYDPEGLEEYVAAGRPTTQVQDGA
ncbi:MAG: DUF2235 domain-containing protein [Actinomycetota bacterium]|nr:DUF2235 domain-containing protein [Actinomycetota bacterium]